MADIVHRLYRTHPLESRKAALTELTRQVAGLTVRAEDVVAAVDLRVDPAGPGADAVRRSLGVALPVEPNTWSHTGDGQIIWLGPDEWLVTSSGARPEEVEREWDRVVSAFDGAAVDVSAQRTGIRLGGALARELLSFGCSLDLRPSAFPAGCCAQTTVGRAGVVILALDDGFRLFVRPSFAGYLVDWLFDAAEEFLPAHSGQPG
jgi:sarcosine oxidase subunit gamma